MKEFMEKLTREPLLVVTTLMWLLNAIIENWTQLQVLLTSLGVAPEHQQTIIAVATFLVSALGWWIARSYVTPLSDPRNENGIQLVPYYKR